MMQQRLFYKVSEVAEALGISRATVWRLIKQGEIPAVRIGRQYFIPRSYVDSLARGGGDGKEEEPVR